MNRRSELLRRLVEFREPLRPIFDELARLPWDPPTDMPAVIVTRDHYRDVLSRYLRVEISASDLEDWASGMECREDLSFEPAHADLLMDLEYRLASPEINEPITPELIGRFLSRLSASGA